MKRVERDSTPTVPTRQHVKRVIVESIKRNKAKQHVFLVCLVNTSVLIELTARNVPLKRTKTNLLIPVVNLALQDANQTSQEVRRVWHAWQENLKKK